MFIAKYELDVNHPKVSQALANGDAMHKLVWGLFDGLNDFAISREELNILYRVIPEMEGMNACLEVHAEVKPNNCPSYLKERYCVTDKNMREKLERLGIVKFNILLNPSKKVDGKRRSLKNYKDRINWLNNMANKNGFKILRVDEKNRDGLDITKGGTSWFFKAVEYQGVLEITDFVTFFEAVKKGIGSGKAYGLGMFLFGV